MWLIDYLIGIIIMFAVGFSLLFLGMFILGPAPSIDNGFHAFLSIIVYSILFKPDNNIFFSFSVLFIFLNVLYSK